MKTYNIDKAAETHLISLGMDKGAVFEECLALIKWGAEWMQSQQPPAPVADGLLKEIAFEIEETSLLNVNELMQIFHKHLIPPQP